MATYLFLAPKLPVPFSPLSPEAFEEIKCLAGKTWLQHTQEYVDCSTSYAAAFGNKGLDESTRGRVTPSSPTRVHRPHPPQVFLVNQLHNLPGHYGNGKAYATYQREATPSQEKFPDPSPNPTVDFEEVQPSTGIHPKSAGDSSDKKKFQVRPGKITHNAVAAASPLAPLEALQQRISHPSLKGTQTGDKNFISSLRNQDMLTGWPVTGKTPFLLLEMESE